MSFTERALVWAKKALKRLRVAGTLAGMKLVCISDTHEMHTRLRLPEGDILVHAGDFTANGNAQSIVDFATWLDQSSFEHLVVIAGNHELSFERSRWARPLLKAHCPRLHYLQDSGVEIRGIKFWGSPWQPKFGRWAFNLARGAPLAKKWAQIPTDCQVIVTHGPPYGYLDTIEPNTLEQLGCHDLAARLLELHDLKVHVFGHIHGGYGEAYLKRTPLDEQGIHLINASICREDYQPFNKPIVATISA